MAEVMSLFSFGRTEGKRVSEEMMELQQALSRCNVELHQAYQCFNSTCEGELIESYVFEINSLHARYNYLLRRLKELEAEL